MAREEERRSRAAQAPVVGGLPDAPGILAAMGLTPGLAAHLRGLADELLVNDFPNSTLVRAERELLATAVSAANDCVYCTDTHGAFAAELLRRSDRPVIGGPAVVEALMNGATTGLEAKLAALVHVARVVRRRPLDLTREDVERALAAGALDGDVQLAVLIASAFSMYNRMVDGLRAKTPPSPEAYRERARQIADHGYSSANVRAVPK